jgi:hypothetical protein
MPVEAATNINALNPLWPLGTDPKSEGDDHLRMLKIVLQAAISDDGTTAQLKRGANFIQRQVITASGAITLHADTKAFLVELQGGGGGGGASNTTGAGLAGAGAGGGAGGYCSRWIVKPSGTYSPTCVVGAGGAAGGTPTNGTASTFSDGTVSMSAGGGLVGSTGVPTSNSYQVQGGLGGTASGGDVNVTGEQGEGGWEFGTAVQASIATAAGGRGGSSRFGAGGAGAFLSGAAGNNSGASGARGPGGGAGGGVAIHGGGSAGASFPGGAGLVVITEFR